MCLNWDGLLPSNAHGNPACCEASRSRTAAPMQRSEYRAEDSFGHSQTETARASPHVPPFNAAHWRSLRPSSAPGGGQQGVRRAFGTSSLPYPRPVPSPRSSVIHSSSAVLPSNRKSDPVSMHARREQQWKSDSFLTSRRLRLCQLVAKCLRPCAPESAEVLHLCVQTTLLTHISRKRSPRRTVSVPSPTPARTVTTCKRSNRTQVSFFFSNPTYPPQPPPRSASSRPAAATAASLLSPHPLPPTTPPPQPPPAPHRRSWTHSQTPFNARPFPVPG